MEVGIGRANANTFFNKKLFKYFKAHMEYSLDNTQNGGKVLISLTIPFTIVIFFTRIALQWKSRNKWDDMSGANMNEL